MSQYGKKIIYMVDMIYNLLPLKISLQKRYQVFPVQSIDSLFDAIESNNPDMIILDINMPGVDSFEAIKALKANPKYAAIPVIFVTAKDDRETIMSTVGLGAADLFTRPFIENELYNRIENQLSSEKPVEYLPVILAVDDNPSELRMINGLLHKQYKVHTLSRPDKLDSLLQKIEPDIFLLDCNMPILSGYDLVPVIRVMPEHTMTPIIFLTADGTVDNLNKAISVGASDFIVKPVEETVLREKLALRVADFMILRTLKNHYD